MFASPSHWTTPGIILGLGLLGTPALLPGQDRPQLQNAGFEDPGNLGVWKQWVYADGKKPVIRADDRQFKEGSHALLIEAEDPADVALGQVVALPAGSVWRARCWVKTENLKARDATDTTAALHIQTPAGATVARGPSTTGTSDWKETQVVFRVPTGGEVKIVLFYIGYGKGTGKAWFDDVRLEPVAQAGRLAIRLTPERLGVRPIDAKQGGQFIEPLCNLIPSLLAQQVANTSFEVDPPWNVIFRRDVDKPHRPWYPDGAVHLAQYTYDTNQPFNGRRSLRIEVSAPRARAGISQDGFYVRAGARYRLRLSLRGTGNVPVRATLHGGGGLLADPVSLGRAGETWQPADAVFRATRTLDQATLTIDFEGAGTLWLDRVSLIGEDAFLGLWRPDAVAAIRALQPGVIRFGGSALESYEWDKCLGPSDQRAPFPQTYWGGIEENFVGVEEFVALCQALGAEPLVCVRWTGKAPADAAAEVEYFNGPAGSPWGKRRAANGHPQPYGVKYWQIGNEVGGAAYDASVRAFARSMREADPAIKILSSFPSDQILEAGGGDLDYLCPHHYGCADLLAMETDFSGLEKQIRRFATAHPERSPVRIAVTEWNTTAGGWELGRASLQTLANALDCSRYHNLMQRHADTVEIAIRSNLIDSFGSGVILTGPDWLYVAPTYHAQCLYARAAGSYPLRIQTASADLPWNLQEPDLSAALSPDGKTLRLYGVNSTEKPINVATTLEGFPRGVQRAQAWVLKDSAGGLTPEIMNTRDEPNRVRLFTRRPAVKGTKFDLAFDPFSLTLYEFTLPSR
jgi:alpha-N-arabinofuranosidase